MEPIFHITRLDQWEAAQKRGVYQGDTLATQGFIHCSTAEQVLPVANAIFRGQTDLVLLVIETERVRPAVRFEVPVNPSTGQAEAQSQERYPHIYGPLNLEAVVEVRDFRPNAEGLFTALRAE